MQRRPRRVHIMTPTTVRTVDLVSNQQSETSARALCSLATRSAAILQTPAGYTPRTGSLPETNLRAALPILTLAVAWDEFGRALPRPPRVPASPGEKGTPPIGRYRVLMQAATIRRGRRRRWLTCRTDGSWNRRVEGWLLRSLRRSASSTSIARLAALAPTCPCRSVSRAV